MFHGHNGVVALGRCGGIRRFLTRALRATADGQHSTHDPTGCLGRNSFVARLVQLACYLGNLVTDVHWTCLLAVDSADHSYSRPQLEQEGHLHMNWLSWFGGFAIDDGRSGAS